MVSSQLLDKELKALQHGSSSLGWSHRQTLNRPPQVNWQAIKSCRRFESTWSYAMQLAHSPSNWFGNAPLSLHSPALLCWKEGVALMRLNKIMNNSM